MNPLRRMFLRNSMVATGLGIAVGAGLLSPGRILAAWPKAAFDAKTIDEAMKDFPGGAKAAASKDIVVEAPDIAENGATVTVIIKTTLPHVEQMWLMVPKNNNPLTSSYVLTSDVESNITGRIKMRESSDVIAIVKAGGKYFTAKKTVKVTLGGCGG